MDFFTLFGLPVRYALDGATLTERFQTLQRQWHPDRFAAGAEQERLQASRQAAMINEAYQILRQPLRRAEYLLSLHGIDVASEQYTLRDTDFLMEQWALREELEALAAGPGAEAALEAFGERLAGLFAAREREAAAQLAQGDWQTAADSVRKLRFLDKARQQMEQLEDALPDR
ncbi:co-chaperone HscB [Martelella alba]|uniref:Co-chaperone protein HscB homolog n=1 Tax=Martelella alba TaxID=2590451 RepID=A0ABY2SRP7_9HYPH|nr:co-chaperone HscB [Martelella alba]TKI06751.1 co-chaperone HscB [Martelella alba]